MQQRYHLVSGKTIEEVTEKLNADDAYFGRIVFMEKTRSGYTALIDTYALIIAHITDINGDEEETREYNRNILENLDLDTSKTL